MNSPKLTNLRNQIDCCDDFLVTILAKRFAYVSEIGKLKKELNLEPLDADRFGEIVKRSRAIAEGQNVSPDAVEEILHTMHKHTLDLVTSAQV